MATASTLPAIHVEYLPSSKYETKISPSHDPFRHQSLANSHNHHKLHPWGTEVAVGSKEFDAKYAQANNEFMYHLWYSPKLNQYMATEVLGVFPVSAQTLSLVERLLKVVLESGIDIALKSDDGKKLVSEVQKNVDSLALNPSDRLFVRIGSTSAKDSFAVDLPTTKPSPLEPKGEVLVRRLLTSGRVVGRLLALSEGIWPEDPGEAVIIQRWAPKIELHLEIRTFIHDGKITAISQDIWWEKLGWRERYSDGLVQAIADLWDNVKSLVPFKTCTMDSLITLPSAGNNQWTAKLIEFNSFGAHLNTGSDLFHWVNDAEILYGKKQGITVRFVDDWEQDDDSKVEKSPAITSDEKPKSEEIVPASTDTTEQEDEEPDWLVLENKLREKFGKNSQQTRLATNDAKLPLRGRWCSAY